MCGDIVIWSTAAFIGAISDLNEAAVRSEKGLDDGRARIRGNEKGQEGGSKDNLESSSMTTAYACAGTVAGERRR